MFEHSWLARTLPTQQRHMTEMARCKHQKKLDETVWLIGCLKTPKQRYNDFVYQRESIAIIRDIAIILRDVFVIISAEI
jgi:hypothetical protein